MSRLRSAAAALLAAGLAACAPKPLRVCADPNNLPFSNARGEGFENRIAELVARDLHRPIRWVWWAQRRGFVRMTLKAGRCDLWPGVATGLERVAATAPYYRSTYVFVTRAGTGPPIASFDDPRLRRLRIGVQMVGNDAMNTPPAHALARRGIVANVRGYMLYGDYRAPNPPAAIVRAVDDGDLDVAVVWGPLAGWYAKGARHPLTITPVRPWLDGPQWPMVFDISMAVRKDDLKLRHQVQQALARERPATAKILAGYGVPAPPSEAGG